MPLNEQFLHVRAGHPNRTYIGATFCPNEGDVRHVYECISEGNQFAVSQLRREAQQTGEFSEESFAGLTITSDESRALLGCLSTIAAGRCHALPTTHLQ